MPSELLPGGHFGLLLRFQLEDDLPLLIPRPKIPVTFDSKSMIKKALHSFFLPASPSFAETFRMNPNIPLITLFEGKTMPLLNPNNAGPIR